MMNIEKFKCNNCGKRVSLNKEAGTSHRNHCPFCLWSRHVDLDESGDRKAECKAKMEPVGLTFKQEGLDKYGKLKQGELMLIHQCAGCGKISINRIAGDDSSGTLLEIFEKSLGLSAEKIEQLRKEKIKILTERDKNQVTIQLLGKNF